MVRQLAVIHHLQKNIEKIGMRLFNFVEQQHAVRVLIDRVGEQSALVEADIAGRSANQPTHRVTLHIFGHVESDQLNAERDGELTRGLRLADAGRTGEEIAADRLFGIA